MLQQKLKDDLGKYICGVINSSSTGVEGNKRRKQRQVSHENVLKTQKENRTGLEGCSIAHISVFL